MARHRRKNSTALVTWLRVGAVTAGIGAAIGSGQAVASAAPSESSEPSVHADGPPPSAGPARKTQRPAARLRARLESAADKIDAVARVSPPDQHSLDAIAERIRTRLDRASAIGGRTPLPRASSTGRGTTSKPAARRLTPRPVVRKVATDGEAQIDVAPPALDPPALDPPPISPVDSAAPAKTPAVAAARPIARLLGAPPPIMRSAAIGTWTRLGLTGTGVPGNAIGDVFAALSMAVREIQHQQSTPTTTIAPMITTADPPSAGPTLDDVRARPGVTASTNDDGTVHIITGTFTDTTVDDADAAAAVVNDAAGLIGAPAGFADADDITVQRIDTAGGYSRNIYRVHHKVDGLDVVGSEVILVTDDDGNVKGLINNYDVRADTMNTTPDARIDTETEAAATALAAYSGAKNPQTFRLIAPGLIAAGIVKPELVVDATDDEAGPQLVWRVSIDPPDTDLTGARSVNPGSTYYISASGTDAGTVTQATSNAQPIAIGSPTSTTANDALGDSRDFGITRLSLIVFALDSLNDVDRDISTYQTAYLLVFLGPPLTPGIPVFKGLTGWDASAVSAHANMAEVYDYYDTRLGVTSFDDAGAPIVVSTEYNPHAEFADYTDGYENAFWDSSGQQFAFGDTGDFEAAVDVVGHEYTHAVVDHAIGNGSGALDYGESGALNEAYADIMGTLIEGKDRDDPGRWTIGEDSTGGVIRDLSNPTAVDGYLDDYDDLYDGPDDEGGEHYNSTIFSHAAYLMMTDDRTTDVTDDEWAQLYYGSMLLLSPGADFADARDAIEFTAGDQGFSDDEKAAITDAFTAVHID